MQIVLVDPIIRRFEVHLKCQKSYINTDHNMLRMAIALTIFRVQETFCIEL